MKLFYILFTALIISSNAFADCSFLQSFPYERGMGPSYCIRLAARQETKTGRTAYFQFTTNSCVTQCFSCDNATDVPSDQDLITYGYLTTAKGTYNCK